MGTVGANLTADGDTGATTAAAEPAGHRRRIPSTRARARAAPFGTADTEAEGTGAGHMGAGRGGNGERQMANK